MCNKRAALLPSVPDSNKLDPKALLNAA